MPAPRETILAALHARLSALPATAFRGEVLPERVPAEGLPERVPAEGLLILRDGEPGGARGDTLTNRIGAALAADRTLGGLCDWVEAEAPRPVDLPVERAASLKAAVIPVVLHYTTADPLV